MSILLFICIWYCVFCRLDCENSNFAYQQTVGKEPEQNCKNNSKFHEESEFISKVDGRLLWKWLANTAISTGSFIFLCIDKRYHYTEELLYANYTMLCTISLSCTEIRRGYSNWSFLGSLSSSSGLIGKSFCLAFFRARYLRIVSFALWLCFLRRGGD